MKTNTKISLVSHVVVLMTGVAIATALFYREDPPTEQHDSMFIYDEADEECGCGDSLDVDTTWVQHNPTNQ